MKMREREVNKNGWVPVSLRERPLPLGGFTLLIYISWCQLKLHTVRNLQATHFPFFSLFRHWKFIALIFLDTQFQQKYFSFLFFVRVFFSKEGTFYWIIYLYFKNYFNRKLIKNYYLYYYAYYIHLYVLKIF